MIPSIAPLGLIQSPDLVERVYGARVQLGHGGEPMGSLMMHVAPGNVQMERAAAWGRRHVFGGSHGVRHLTSLLTDPLGGSAAATPS